ncbi:MAG: hypothetical protein QNJ34_28355 [Xenococcaceae cyanobacterium MO_188.B29]|nr:hypothetical protein [Xenococcaceae cyanobacterium MO_188.B29]
MGRQTLVDWDAIFSDYLNGFWETKGNMRVHCQPTLEHLATKYGIANSTVRNHASENNWKQKREHYQASLGSDRGYFTQISSEMAADILATARLLLGNLRREVEAIDQGKLPKNLRTDIAQRRLNNAKTLQTLQNCSNAKSASRSRLKFRFILPIIKPIERNYWFTGKSIAFSLKTRSRI